MESNKLDFNDYTVLTTPKPQASSTVERKSYRRETGEQCHSNHPNRLTDASMEIPTRDTDQETVSEKLEKQRLLAQIAMEKFDSKGKSSIPGLHSYLFKPTNTPAGSKTMDTPIKNESTVNLSDLERSLPTTSCGSDKISFEANEISARSSSFGNKPTVNSTDFANLRSPSPVRGSSTDFASKYQSIYDRIRKSDMSLAEICDRSSKLGVDTEPFKHTPLSDVHTINISSDSNRSSWCPQMQDSLMEKLQNELFTPAELAGSKLMADEISWRKAKDVLPASDNRNNHLDLSCFSGYIGDSDISSGSTNNDKVSFTEFFKRRSEDVETMDLKTSPKKKHVPVPLINISHCTTSNAADDFSELPLDTSSQPESPAKSAEESVLSATRIAEALFKMDANETPSRVLDLLMKKVPTKPPRASVNTPISVQSNSALKNSRESDATTPGFSTLKPSSFSSEYVTSINKNNSAKENQSKQASNAIHVVKMDKTNSQKILRDTTNLPSTEADLEIIELSSDEWTDVRPNVACTPDKNGTVSSVTESPSYSCSELEFSEDERSEFTNEKRHTDIGIDDWIHIEQQDYPIKTCLNIATPVPLILKSKTKHWLHVTLSVKDVSSNSMSKDTADVTLGNNDSMLKSYDSEEFKFNIVCYDSGIVNVLLKIDMIDMVTKTEKSMEYIVFVEADPPKVKISSNQLDYKLCPEGSIKAMLLTITNDSNVNLPLVVSIIQEREWIFVFGSETEKETDPEADGDVNREIQLAVGSSVKLIVDMRAPSLNELEVHDSDTLTLKGGLKICLTGNVTTTLKTVTLVGKIGLTKVQFKTSCMPFVLLPGQPKPLQVRNSGVVPLELSASISGSDVKDSYFNLDTYSIVLNPSQVGTIYVTFNMKEKVVGSIKRTVRLEYHRGPSFVLPIEGITDAKINDSKLSPNVRSPKIRSPSVRSPSVSRSPNICRSPRPEISPNARSRSSGAGSCQSSDLGTITCLQDGKLPIESTRTELVWGCIKPGKSITQEFVLRNRCSQRVRLQAVINGSGCFKFVKDHTDSSSSTTLVLHSLESRTIAVSFSPTNKGAASARLMFLPSTPEVVSTKKQMIQLYGYGGHTCIDVQKVAKDTGGKMWLSFGRLDYRDTLQQVFVLRNTGTLSAFACLTVCCKVLYPFMDSSVKLSPTELVIEPNKEAEVTVSFTPRPEDFKYIQKSSGIEVSEIASIKILSGPEPTRGRIRRLFNKISSGNQGSNSNSVLTQLSTNFLVPRLSGVFPGEKIPDDVAAICREGSSSLRDLIRDIDTRDLILTIERDTEYDSGALGNVADETCMFQSLMCANGTVNETTLTTTGRPSGGFCTVEPRKLILSPPLAPQGAVVVKSHHSRPMPFEVCVPSSASEAGLEVVPRVGVLTPGEMALVTVTATKFLQRSLYTCLLMIYVENEVMEVTVKICSNPTRRS